MNRPVRFQLLFALLVFTFGCQAESITEPNVVEQSRSESFALTDQVVEAACGQCLFGLTGDGCDLAIRVDGQAYFVDGTNIDEHGDAHAEDGFLQCNSASAGDGNHRRWPVCCRFV